ncbi:MAG: DUF4190 domain-containing protein [Verrucomicrobia bacterium]|nr:DUF4190 domain-containing protein [Verrucomicrobiota bacterium]
MFKIIGADQREYGPVNEEQLRDWIRDKRATPRTLACKSGTNEWKPLNQWPEFSFEGRDDILKSPIKPAGVMPRGGYMNNGLAVAGLVLSICGLLCCGGPVLSALGLIFGLIGLSEIDRNPMVYRGRGIALAAIIIALIGFAQFAFAIGVGALRFIAH